MNETLEYLYGIVVKNEFTKMKEVLSSIDQDTDILSKDDVDRILAAYIEDLQSYLDERTTELTESNEYVKTMKEIFTEAGVIHIIKNADFSHDVPVEDVVSYFKSYKYIRYNRELNDTFLAIWRHEKIDPHLYLTIEVLWAIYNIFIKDVTHIAGKTPSVKELGKKLDFADDSFTLCHCSPSKKMILFHIRDAVAHGRITSLRDMTMDDYETKNDGTKKNVFVIETNYSELASDFQASMHSLLPHLDEGSKYTYNELYKILKDPNLLDSYTTFETCCLAFLSNYSRYAEYDVAFVEDHCRNVDVDSLFPKPYKAFHTEEMKGIRNQFAHNIRFKDGVVILGDEEKTMTPFEFMACTDALKFMSDLTFIKCIQGATNLGLESSEDGKRQRWRGNPYGIHRSSLTSIQTI